MRDKTQQAAFDIVLRILRNGDVMKKEGLATDTPMDELQAKVIVEQITASVADALRGESYEDPATGRSKKVSNFGRAADFVEAWGRCT
jgi:hypothetical protein